jgi:hypothetical protein
MRLVAFLATAATLLAAAAAHEHHGEAPTCAGGGGRVLAEFRPGEITLDGHNDDWDGVEASEFALLPALDPDEDKAYSGGKVAVKVRVFNSPPTLFLSLCPFPGDMRISTIYVDCGTQLRRLAKVVICGLNLGS